MKIFSENQLFTWDLHISILCYYLWIVWYTSISIKFIINLCTMYICRLFFSFWGEELLNIYQQTIAWKYIPRRYCKCNYTILNWNVGHIIITQKVLFLFSIDLNPYDNGLKSSRKCMICFNVSWTPSQKKEPFSFVITLILDSA